MLNAITRTRQKKRAAFDLLKSKGLGKTTLSILFDLEIVHGIRQPWGQETG